MPKLRARKMLARLDLANDLMSIMVFHNLWVGHKRLSYFGVPARIGKEVTYIPKLLNVPLLCRRKHVPLAMAKDIEWAVNLYNQQVLYDNTLKDSDEKKRLEFKNIQDKKRRAAEKRVIQLRRLGLES